VPSATRSGYHKPYLDSSVFIAWIKGEQIGGVDRKAIVEHILSVAQQGKFKIYTSALTLAEVHKKRNQPALSSDQDDRILAFFEHDFIELIEIDRRTGEHANRLCREFVSNGLLPNDALHLACALSAGCDVLLAWDARLTSIRHADITVEEPSFIGERQLPNISP
jgi:predicted nucleic acid-binding protein